MRNIFIFPALLSACIVFAGAASAQNSWGNETQQQKDQSTKDVRDNVKDGLDDIGKTEDGILNPQGANGGSAVNTDQLRQSGSEAARRSADFLTNWR